MSVEQKRGYKDALPYLKFGVALLLVGIGSELATSFSQPLVHILLAAGGSYTFVNGAFYFFGRNDLPETTEQYQNYQEFES
jgi:hypothetical protein